MVGSGPFRYVADERVQGARNVYQRFEGYKPRDGGVTDWLSGPKVVHFDRVEWTTIPDGATAAAALQSGEQDWWEQATPDLLPMLAGHGHLSLAYELLFQGTVPSWLAMIDRGATTMWERWDGLDADGIPHESLNHYSKGAVISFLHRHVAGLQRLEAAWRRFRVQPRPGGGITWASTEHVTPHGLAAVHWRQDGELELTVTVPPGCTAEVVLPSGTRDIGPGTTTFAE